MIGMSKIKDASWYLVVADEQADKVLCLKKIMIKNDIRRKVQVSLPDRLDGKKLSVFLFSDCFIGLD